MPRNASLDILKLVLAIMVVGLHTEFLSDFNALASYLTVNGLFRVAVPVFLLINGYYFFDVLSVKRQWAWFRRIFTLYFIWMGVYAYFWLPTIELSTDAFLEVFFLSFIGYWHLWYVSGMLGAALLVVALKDVALKLVTAFAAVAFAIGVAIQYAGNYHLLHGETYDILFNFHPSHRNFLFFSFPFFYSGYLINKYSIQDRFSLPVVTRWAVIGGILLITESYINFIHPGRDGEFDNFASLAIAGPAIFILTLKLYVEGRERWLSEYSAAIYFIHVLIIHLIFVFVYISGSILTIAVLIISALVSILLIKANGKIKVLL